MTSTIHKPNIYDKSGFSSCVPIQFNTQTVYTHSIASHVHNISFNTIENDIMRVFVNGEIMAPLTPGMNKEHFIYIIGRNTSKATNATVELQTEDIEDIDKRGDFVILFSLLNNPFDLGGKHIELLMYGLNRGYLNIPIIYVAGEAMKTNDGKLLMNFLGGLYMSDYKKQWLEVLLDNPVIDIEKSNIEMYWFNKDIKQIIERLTSANGKIEYSNLDTLGIIKYQIYPNILNKIIQLGVHVEFYKTEEACHVRDAVARYEGLKGKKSTVALIALRKYMTDDGTGSGIMNLKPEFSNYKQQMIPMEEVVGRNTPMPDTDADAADVGADHDDMIYGDSQPQPYEQNDGDGDGATDAGDDGDARDDREYNEVDNIQPPPAPGVPTDAIQPNPVATNEAEPSIIQRLFNTVAPPAQPAQPEQPAQPTNKFTGIGSPTMPKPVQFNPDMIKPVPAPSSAPIFGPTTADQPQTQPAPSSLQPITLTGGSGGTRKNRSSHKRNKSKRSLFSYA